jgi:hypothetical protein
MGYDLHITRRTRWTDDGNDIAVDEWLTYIQSDVELHRQPENGPCFVAWTTGTNESWLDWSNGQIYSKSPDRAAIAKMVSIARHLDAHVQGDDGEIYSSGDLSPRPASISLRRRLANWLSGFRVRSYPPITHEPLPFGVGDTVRDVWGKEHEVIAIDPKAEHGMGLIRTRRRSDGTEHLTTMIAHYFQPTRDQS